MDINKVWMVGGEVRDSLLGLPIKDVDFCVEGMSLKGLEEALVASGAKIHVVKEEFLTVRCKLPEGHQLFDPRSPDADFVVCRKDSETSDGRRPDFVEPGTIMDDLARRDFTVNAMARNMGSGEILDPFGGQNDLSRRVLRFVGEPEDRIREDGLRVIRAFRFEVVKGFKLEMWSREACLSPLGAAMLAKVSKERIADELEKMFKFDNVKALDRIMELRNDAVFTSIFPDGLRLMPTMKQ